MKKLLTISAMIAAGSMVLAAGTSSTPSPFSIGLQGLTLVNGAVTGATLQYNFSQNFALEGGFGLTSQMNSGGTTIFGVGATAKFGISNNGPFHTYWGPSLMLAKAYASDNNTWYNTSSTSITGLGIGLCIGAEYFLQNNFSLDGRIYLASLSQVWAPDDNSATIVGILSSSGVIPVGSIGFHYYL